MAPGLLGTQVRPYRDYLTPALHRRFNRASRYTILLCYAIACWMGEWDNALWIWFPIGPTGARTLLIFLTTLIVYVLRVAQWHVGSRQTQTRAETFTKYSLRKSSLVTLIFYSFSAWLYSEIYIWSRSSDSKLGFTDAGRVHERVRLNERPLYLRYLFLVLAVAQTILHLGDDYDSIDVPALQSRTHQRDQDTALATLVRSSPQPRLVLLKKLPSILSTSAMVGVVSYIVGSAIYFLGPRNIMWEYYYSFSRSFIGLSKTSRPTGLAPFIPLALGIMTESSLLVFLWQFVNSAFDLYIAQEPLKNGKPITNESKDPNGTLLNGLKSKKDAVRAIAFWELALITEAFPDRRKTIYNELERKKAPTSQQVTDVCLSEVRLLIERINVGLDPNYNPIPSTGQQQPNAPIDLVPRIAKPLQADKQIATLPTPPNSQWERIEATTAGIAKSHSTPGNAKQAYGREVLNKGMKKAHEGAQQAESVFTLYHNKLISSYLGLPFRHSLERTAKLVVLGAPYSRISLICNAVTALTNLSTFSLKNDDYGRFHEGVPAIIRIFTVAINKIDEYMAKVEIHWSDQVTLMKPGAEQRRVPEVEQVRECLRRGLERILGSFNEFLVGLGMSDLEILDAKKAVGVTRTPEMMQTDAAR